MVEHNSAALRITNQFRRKESMVYDLRSNGERLTVIVSPRATVDDTGDWHVEARVGGRPDTECIEHWAATRIDALRGVGRAWNETTVGALPRFDWDAVAKALLDVRAV